MKETWNRLSNIATSIAIFVAGLVIFPHFDNKELAQSHLRASAIAAFLILVSYLSMLFISKATKLKYNWIFFVSGLLSLLLFVFVLSKEYYPYVNRNVLNLKKECGTVILKGDSVNYSRLVPIPGINYDSLSKDDPASFVQQTQCNPALAWTLESIENNLNGLLFRYGSLILFFSICVFSLIRAAFRKL